MITLKPFASDDIERLLACIPDATFLLQWAGPTLQWPLTRDQLEKDIGKFEAQPTTRSYSAFASDGTWAGHIVIKTIDHAHRNAMLGRILANPQQRGRGLGALIVDGALEICFNELNLHRVGLRVFSHNAAAIRCYQKVGFVIEGHERHTKLAPDGQWWDAITMAILDDDWRTRRA